MRTIGPLLSSAALCLAASANDGAYMSSGGIIYPVKETRIALAKEFLSFTCHDKKARVEVLFEFMNPEAVERTLLVGFQAPAAAGDVAVDRSIPQIRDFRILHQGKLLPCTMKVAECGDCPLQDPGEEFEMTDGGIFVYLFELAFKPGINQVRHSYEFPASSHVYFDEIYRYVLRTGSKWAGSSISEFNLQVDMGSNKYFYMSDVFGKDADWSIIGTGKVTDVRFSDDNECRMVRTLSGKLMVTARNLMPEGNIEFGVIDTHSFFGAPLESGGLRAVPHRRALEGSATDMSDRLASLTKEELRLLRNTIYAQHGYRFADKDLLEFFSRFDWYIPDPNLRMDQIRLSAAEQRFIEEIVRKEKG